jgi:hypothetical protein
MTRGWGFTIAGGVVLLALAGCGRSFFMDGERAAWRHDAEVACIKSGAVKIGVERIEPIEGPGMCGADFPFKVTALGEAPVMSYADELRPPAAVPNASSSDMPRWPASESRYAPPLRVAPVQSEPVYTAPVKGETMRWVPGPQGIIRSESGAPSGQPMSISPPGTPPSTYTPQRAGPPTQSTYQSAYPNTYPSARPRSYHPSAAARPNDIPADAIIPPGGSAAVPAPSPQSYSAPVYQPAPQRRAPPRLGTRAPYNPAAVPAAQLTPAAKLACPIVSALDRWVSEGVQPAALRWFRSPVVEIKQISAYSCRSMNGAGGHGISEHAFGNALDIAAFTLADGRKITVKDGWHGSAEEQGFLHDVQLYACETFVTVLAPGYNAAHYNHIHVDLMRREPGYRPCRPEAIKGEIVAARVRAHYASHHRGPAYTGSVGAPAGHILTAIPGADGYVADDNGDVPGSIAAPHGDFAASTGKPSAAAGQNAFTSDRDSPANY